MRTFHPEPLEAIYYWKALAILSDTMVRRSAVDQEDLKGYWKSEKRPHFSRWSTILLFTKILKTLLTTQRRLTGERRLASIIIAYFCFKLIESRGVIKTNAIEVDNVFQEYLWWSSFLLGKAFHSYFFLYVCVGSELLYSSCYLDCITYNYLFYFECIEQLSFEEHLSIIASDTGYRIIHMLLTI